MTIFWRWLGDSRERLGTISDMLPVCIQQPVRFDGRWWRVQEVILVPYDRRQYVELTRMVNGQSDLEDMIREITP